MTGLVLPQDLLEVDHGQGKVYLDLAEELCWEYHGNQKRQDGSCYMDHVMDVKRQVLDFMTESGRIDVATIVGAMCHDLIEDSYGHEVPVTSKLLYQYFSNPFPEFGADVAYIVEAVSKRPMTEFTSKELRLDEYHHRLLRMARANPQKYYGIIIIKYADRMHNLWTLYALTRTDPSKVDRIANETINFYVNHHQLALEILPPECSDTFRKLVEQMKRQALVWLPNKYDVDYSFRHSLV